MIKYFLLAALILSAKGALAGVDEPAGCWEKSAIPCAYRSAHSEWISIGKNRLRTSSGGSFTRVGENELQVLSGDLWIEAVEPVTLIFGPRRFVSAGAVWARKENSMLRLLQFSGQTMVQGSLPGETLPGGFSNWWTLSDQGVLIPFSTKKTLSAWIPWLGLGQEEIRQRVSEYKTSWKNRVDESSNLYHDVLQRRIAGIEERQERQHRAEVANQKAGEQFRQMFHDRFFNP